MVIGFEKRTESLLSRQSQMRRRREGIGEFGFKKDNEKKGKRTKLRFRKPGKFGFIKRKFDRGAIIGTRSETFGEAFGNAEALEKQFD